MDLLAEIEALQAELAFETPVAPEDKKVLEAEVNKTQKAAAAAKGARKKKAEPVATEKVEEPVPVVEEVAAPVVDKPKAKVKGKAVDKPVSVNIDGLPKKVQEKALNAVKHLETGAELSRYTALALKKLKEGGVKRSELVAFYVEKGLGMSTANAQASQMRSLLPAIGAAVLDGETLIPVPSSPFLA